MNTFSIRMLKKHCYNDFTFLTYN